MLNNSNIPFFDKTFAFIAPLSLSQATLIFIHIAKQVSGESVYNPVVEEKNREIAGQLAAAKNLNPETFVEFTADSQVVARAMQEFWIKQKERHCFGYEFSGLEKQLLAELQVKIPELKQSFSLIDVQAKLNKEIAKT